MASKEFWSSDVCPICSKKVEIFNEGDFQFSMDLHMQSHKALETINQELSEEQKKVQSNDKTTENYMFYPEFKQNVKISNNDVNSTIKPAVYDYEVNKNQSALSSSRKNTSKKKLKDVSSHSVSVRFLEQMFDSFPTELKFHRGFLSQNKNGADFCKICNVIVEPIIGVSEHLKTKIHENNILQVLTDNLPVELRHIMEFVSFSFCCLYCNLCEIKLDLSSNSTQETILSITLHNLSKVHVEKKAGHESNSMTNEVSRIVTSLAEFDPLINENQHFIGFEMQPEFICKLCNVKVAPNVEKKELIRLFNEHFLSKTHFNYVAVSVLETFYNRYNIHNKEHNFILINSIIHCTICNMYIPTRLEELTNHVKPLPCNGPLYSVNVIENELPKTSQESLGNKPTANFLGTANNQYSYSETISQEEIHTKLQILLDALPEHLRNINGGISVTKKGKVICLICNIAIPYSVNILKHHLTGKKHKKIAAKNKLITNTKLKEDLSENPASSNSEINCGQPVSKEELLSLDCDTKSPSHNNFVETVVSEPATNNNIKENLDENPKYFKNNTLLQPSFKNKFHCIVCDVIVHKTSKEKHLLIASHIKAAQEHILTKLSKTDENVKNCITLFDLKEKFLTCRPCQSEIMYSDSEQSFTSSILNHTSEKIHKRKVGEIYSQLLEKCKASEPVIEANSKFLEIKLGEKIYCTLCSCDILGSCEEDVFKNYLLAHLATSMHNIGGNNSNYDSLLSENNRTSSNSLTHLLNSLSIDSEDDIPYVKEHYNSDSSEYYASCSLCNCTVNLNDLGEHLREKSHNQMKALKIESLSHCITIERQACVRNMGTLLSLLHSVPINNECQTNSFPIYSRDDIPYVKELYNSDSSEYYASCSLCNCTVNLNDLGEHLREKSHNQMKALKIESLSHSKYN